MTLKFIETHDACIFKTYQSKKVKIHIIIPYYLFRYDDTIPIISYNIRILLVLLFKPIGN